MQPTPSAAERWPAARVREAFLDYFLKHPRLGHEFVPTSPVVLPDDPTLLFANSGMAQFKTVFLGQEPPNSVLGALRRVANSQVCIRAGGKHNDLDDVGRDTYHHTCFEMLGSWSFGDYFQEQAIEMAFELLTGVFGLSPDRLYATYFEGDASESLAEDATSRALWLKYLPPSHVLPGDKRDNFWEMGQTGPCGPCTEIHYDRVGGGRDAAALVNQDDPDVLEVWNLVFMRYNREASGSLRPLPRTHVDTGMGFERLVSVLQDRKSNYDTDVFAALFRAIEAFSGARPYAGLVGEADRASGLVDTGYRIVADHVRTLCFAIADGCLPGASDRGYILRRILRRACRSAREHLGSPGGLLPHLAPVVIETLGGFFPRLRTAEAQILTTLWAEEQQFQRCLVSGIARFRAALANRRADETTVSAAEAYHLYTVYGFPVDLTRAMAEDAGLALDEEGYLALLEQNRCREREQTKRRHASEAGEDFTPGAAVVEALQALGIAPTVERKYEAVAAAWETALEAAVLDGRDVLMTEIAAPVPESASLALVLHETPFYAMSGGQVADRGRIFWDDDNDDSTVFLVHHVAAAGGYVFHFGRFETSDGCRRRLRGGARCWAQVDAGRRAKVSIHHTATHLLNLALREVLGPSADQRGSVVDEDRLRFDYFCADDLPPDYLARVEACVRRTIAADLAVSTVSVALKTARAIAGVRAVFGERYPDPARVVAIGADAVAIAADPEDERWREFSVELCGGTHVRSTAAIEDFAILTEAARGANIRRIVAVAGAEAIADVGLSQNLARAHGLLRLAEAGDQAPTAALAAIEALALPQLQRTSFRAQLNRLAAARAKQRAADSRELVAAADRVIEAELAAIAAQTPSDRPIVVILDGRLANPQILARVARALFVGAGESRPVAVAACAPGRGLLQFAAARGADRWAAAALARLGIPGKAGGASKVAQASFENTSDRIDSDQLRQTLLQALSSEEAK